MIYRIQYCLNQKKKTLDNISFVDNKSTLPSSHAMIKICAVISTQLHLKHHFARFGSDYMCLSDHRMAKSALTLLNAVGYDHDEIFC